MSATTPSRVWRSAGGRPPEADDDHLATEAPLEIRVAGRRLGVTMRTPGHDEELALGLLVAEGVLARREDVATFAQTPAGTMRNVIDVTPAPGVAVDFDRLGRHVMVTSACGLCGAPSLDAVHRHLPPVAPGPPIPVATLLALPALLEEAQPAFRATGGLHAAALFDRTGRLVAAREDVGRHNAVDKIVGWGLLAGRLPFDDHVLLVSGRASFEIVQKALAARIPTVASVSAASSAAVALADEAEQLLVGFLRPPDLTVYTHRARIAFDSAGGSSRARPL
jgi:FdhD protein